MGGEYSNILNYRRDGNHVCQDNSQWLVLVYTLMNFRFDGRRRTSWVAEQLVASPEVCSMESMTLYIVRCVLRAVLNKQAADVTTASVLPRHTSAAHRHTSTAHCHTSTAHCHISTAHRHTSTAHCHTSTAHCHICYDGKSIHFLKLAIKNVLNTATYTKCLMWRAVWHWDTLYIMRNTAFVMLQQNHHLLSHFPL